MYGVYNIESAVEYAMTLKCICADFKSITHRVRIPYTTSLVLNVYSIEYPYNIDVRYQEPNRDWSMYKASSYTASP
jgi:hypothetical protein